MAIRYCKNVKIDCKLVPATPYGEQYKCNISRDGKKLGVQYVGLPNFIGGGIDSPKAYDSAAHAALAFAVDQDGDLADYLEYTDSGFAIRRQKAYRHEVGPRGGGSYR
jgi:hypothetical protein